MAEVFEQQKKVRKAKLVMPPNLLKGKTGSGGFDPTIVTKAQTMLEENTVDFKPIAIELLDELEKSLPQEGSTARTEDAIEAVINPAMQLRAQGTMFHYPLVTRIADILINFLETITGIDKDVVDIVKAHKMSMNVVIAKQLTGEGGAVGKGLCAELVDACDRYYKAKKA